ncbi:lipopolysaccharide kinase InaA family protein [Isosphaeraceae bacterium EP7]
MNHGSFFARLFRGSRWAWQSDRHVASLPVDLDATVMGLQARDRLHEKQGRSTARVVFRADSGEALPTYLKRHYSLPWPERLSALLNPAGRHSPATAEFAHLEHARSLGVPVPEVVAAGERIGPWGRLESYLIVAELTGSDELNLIIPRLAAQLDPETFARSKRLIIARMAELTARLHADHCFHKDLYLCHFYLDPATATMEPPALSVIDLHRMGRHRWTAWRWRTKDLAQLLFSTRGVVGINGRDILRFWKHYRAWAEPRRPHWQAEMIRRKAGRYERHNAGPDRVGGSN